MKMKKLTALALAGVLCLGMSTTAFAAASPGPADAIKATEDGKKITTGEAPGFDGWKSSDPKTVNKSVINTFKDRLQILNDMLDDEEWVNENLTPAQKAAYEAEREAIKPLADKSAKYEIAYLADLQGVATEDNKVNVRFDLNGRLSGLKAGETINILHQNTDTGAWEVYPAEVKSDDKGWYTEWAFDHFSPVAVVRMTSAGPVIDPTEPEDPTEPTEPTNPVVPTDPSINNGANANGTITADQLADLIVKKLQQNAAAATKAGAVVRTTGKASPKTGE